MLDFARFARGAPRLGGLPVATSCLVLQRLGERTLPRASPWALFRGACRSLKQSPPACSDSNQTFDVFGSSSFLWSHFSRNLRSQTSLAQFRKGQPYSRAPAWDGGDASRKESTLLLQSCQARTWRHFTPQTSSVS